MGRFCFICLILASGLFAHEGGSFEENHYRFVVKHLPKLMDGEVGKVLLVGPFNPCREKLVEQYPLIEFEGMCVWNGYSWAEVVKKRNLHGPFDCIVAMHILEREPDREKVLQIISGLLRPGGKILLYLDPKEEDSLDQRIEQYVRGSKWRERVPIIPTISISEYVELIENAGLYILDQSPEQYLVYYASSFGAFLSLSGFVCPRWPIPRTDWDDEMFAGEIRGCLNRKHEIVEVLGSCPEFNSWIEDVLPTYYFIIQK